MARINLLTIHWGLSYGGTMQTYATVKLLENLGHQVRVINLVHPKEKMSRLIAHNHRLSFWIKRIQFAFFRHKYIRHFTQRMYSLHSDKIPPCDYTIVGSDQVWNKDITGPLCYNYYLDFADDSVRISLSSSFGKTKWEEDTEYTQRVKDLLLHFKAISVRELSAQHICQNVFGLNATCLLDPTLLLGNYDSIVEKGREQSILYPFLLEKNDSSKQSICKMLASELETPMYEASRFDSYFKRSPKSWLNKMRNSRYIVTDSFHGLAFSIIFKKDFFVLSTKNPKQFTRLESLLSLLGLSDRYIRSVDDLIKRNDDLRLHIDYGTIDPILETERKKFQSFITQNLE